MRSEACARCGGSTVRGFVIDYGHNDRRKVSHWAEGAPEKSFWTGTAKPEGKILPVATFRCSVCGHLESFADAEFDAE